MTPDLLEQGARRTEQRKAAANKASPATESGGRNASTGRIAKPEGEVDLTHGRILRYAPKRGERRAQIGADLAQSPCPRPKGPAR